MKKPIKPINPMLKKPHKPALPEEFLNSRVEISPGFGEIWSLNDLINKLPSEIKPEEINITAISNDDVYDSSYVTSIFYWSKIKNPNYKFHMKLYNKYIKEYENLQVEYEKKYETNKIKYEKDLEKFNSDMEIYTAWAKEQELKSLEKRITQLKKESARRISQLKN